ncbi:MAG: M48 family metallopeptidase [Elusimicrobiota bacterium]
MPIFNKVVRIIFLLFLALYGTLNSAEVISNISLIDKIGKDKFLEELPAESLKDDRAFNYAKGIFRKLTEFNSNRNHGDIKLLKTARVQGRSEYMTGEILITRGMLNMMHNESEFACFIGHEIGHQTLNHWKRKEQKSEQRDLGQINRNKLSENASKKVEHIKDDQDLQEMLNEFKKQQDAYKKQQEKDEIEQSGWSKELEIEADKFGAELAAKAGYDPFSLCDLFERLSKRIEDDATYRQKKLTGTHPALVDRAVELRKYLEAKEYVPEQGVKNTKSYREAMDGLAKIKTGETLEKARMKVDQFLNGLGSGNKKHFVDELIFQDSPDWDASPPDDPQKVKDSIDNALKNIEYWHNKYGDYICNIFADDVASRLGCADFKNQNGDPLTANQIYDFISNNSSWHEITNLKIVQDYAREGYLVIGVSNNLSGSGHVVVVNPYGNLRYSDNAGTDVPSVYDSNYPDPNLPNTSGNSWRYDDNSADTPKWFYRSQ